MRHYARRGATRYRPRRGQRILSVHEFERKLLKHLGDSHEARQMTETDLVVLYTDYFKSGKSFRDWVKGFKD